MNISLALSLLKSSMFVLAGIEILIFELPCRFPCNVAWSVKVVPSVPKSIFDKYSMLNALSRIVFVKVWVVVTRFMGSLTLTSHRRSAYTPTCDILFTL